MSNDEGTYAPKSPDLSFFSAPEPTSAVQTPNRNSLYPSYQSGQASYSQPQPHHNSYLHPAEATGIYNTFGSYTPGGGRPQQYYPPQQQTPYDQTPRSPYGAQLPTQPQPYYSSYSEACQPTQYQPPQTPQAPTSAPITYDQLRTSEPSSAMPPRKVAQVAQQTEVEPSPVKTKFPTARIKRIMQADEEVGKVAQQTPIAVGKALELFMVQLVTKSADVAKEKNSKRITAQMLKQAIDSNNEWDFLREIVSKVSEKEESTKAGKSKAETDSDEEAEPAEPKKKGRGGRKKKAAT